MTPRAQDVSVTILSETPGDAQLSVFGVGWATSRLVTGPVDPAREALLAAFPCRADRDRASATASPARHYELSDKRTFTVYTVTISERVA